MDPEIQLVTATDLGVRQGGVDLLRGVDLRVFRDELAVVTGPDPRRLSALVAALAGRAPLETGALTITGTVSPGTIAPDVPGRTALHAVRRVLRDAGVRGVEARRRTTDVVRRFGVDHLGRRRLSAVSAADLARVRLACAVAPPGDVVLLDEPVRGLTGSGNEALARLVGPALRAPGRAVLVVSTSVELTRALRPDRVHVLREARVIESGGLAGLDSGA